MNYTDEQTGYIVSRYKDLPHMETVEHLAEELGDLQAMINLCIDHNLVDKEEVIVAADNKIAKLKKWSNIFESGVEHEQD